MFSSFDYNTIELIEKEYSDSDLPWTLGFSGGKDSSALLKLVYNALLKTKNRNKTINVVYSDTGVEIPIIKNFVIKTFNEFQLEIEEYNLPIKLHIIEPKLEDRFFVKVIGRGYPPPTNKFRWCTDRLRVFPLQSLFKEKINNIVLIGVRKGESIERNKIIEKHNTNNQYYLKQSNFPNVKIFAPIINYNTNNVWSVIKNNQKPFSINGTELESIYKSANNTNFNDVTSKALGKGRFGCWTCTVVRKDKAVKNLIKNGYSKLKPLYDFRNWLLIIRDNINYRSKYRRNGQIGLGPFTIEARKIIFEKLIEAQNISGYNIINDNEIDIILKLWKKDRNDVNYKEK